MTCAKPAPCRLDIAAAAVLVALVAFCHVALAVEGENKSEAPAGARGASNAGSGGSGAVDRQAIRRVCENDLRTYCAGIVPGGGRLMQCARAHEAELSAACRSALANFEAYRKARAR